MMEPLLIGYARVSTQDQNLDMQIRALHAVGVSDDHLHTEKISASAKRRPALDLAIKDLREGDTLVVWRLDRLARNMRELYARLDQIYEQGAGFRSITENFDFGSVTGKFILGILGLVAQFEAQLIAHRTAAGMAAAKERGLLMGRKRMLTEGKLDRIYRMLKEGQAARSIAERLHIAPSSIYGYFIVRTGARGQRIVTRRPGTK